MRDDRRDQGPVPQAGLAYAAEPMTVVVPDILVHRTSDGWRVELNTATLPRVLINHSYYVELARQRPTSQPRRT